MGIPQRFTLDPDPPTSGKVCVICFDFLAEPPVEAEEVAITLTFGPPGISPSSVTWVVTKAAPCKEVAMPDRATSGLLADDQHLSADKLFPVSPP